MQAIENPAGTVQASSHYACGTCEGAQAEEGVRNATGGNPPKGHGCFQAAKVEAEGSDEGFFEKG